MIPMIFTMGVAFFVIHGNDPFSLKELAFVYLVIFILMYIAGPGKFSLDRLIAVPLVAEEIGNCREVNCAVGKVSGTSGKLSGS